MKPRGGRPTHATPTDLGRVSTAAKIPPPAEGVVRIIPLGGVEEIGRNMTAVEFGNDIFILDCGFAFSEDDTPRVRTHEQQVQRGVIRQPAPASPTAQVAPPQTPPQVEIPQEPEVVFVNPNPEPPPPAAPAAQGSQFTGMEWMGLPEQNLAELFNYLEGSYSQQKSPADVAGEMVSQHGPDLIKVVLNTVPIDRLLSSIKQAQATKETALSRNKGQKWLSYVWAELGKAVSK